MEKPTSSYEQKIISYLCTYGNTKETDLITYGIQKLGLSEADMVMLVEEMVFSGRIERIMHKELKPAAVYLKQTSLIPLELELQAISDSQELAEATNQQIEKIKEILKKAQTAAKRKIKQEKNALD